MAYDGQGYDFISHPLVELMECGLQRGVQYRQAGAPRARTGVFLVPACA